MREEKSENDPKGQSVCSSFGVNVSGDDIRYTSRKISSLISLLPTSCLILLTVSDGENEGT